MIKLIVILQRGLGEFPLAENHVIKGDKQVDHFHLQALTIYPPKTLLIHDQIFF